MPLCIDRREPRLFRNELLQSLRVNCFLFQLSIPIFANNIQLEAANNIQLETANNIQLETVRPYSTKPGTQEMSLMALTLYFLTQTLYTKYQIEERPPLE